MMRASEIAEKIGTDGRTFREFLRAPIADGGRNLRAGKGKQYAFPDLSGEQIDAVKAQFESYLTTAGSVSITADALGLEAETVEAE